MSSVRGELPNDGDNVLIIGKRMTLRPLRGTGTMFDAQRHPMRAG